MCCAEGLHLSASLLYPLKKELYCEKECSCLTVVNIVCNSNQVRIYVGDGNMDRISVNKANLILYSALIVSTLISHYYSLLHLLQWRRKTISTRGGNNNGQIPVYFPLGSKKNNLKNLAIGQ